MSPIKSLIVSKRFTMQAVIDETKIARNKFFLGMNHPAVFTEVELRKISKAIGVSYAKIQEVIIGGN